MIQIDIKDNIIQLYKETIAKSMLKRRNFKRFGLSRTGKDITENKLFEFYKILVKNKSIKLNNKRIKLKDLLVADYNTMVLIIKENKNIIYAEHEKKLTNEYYKDFRKKWAYILVEELNTSVCPYCNRNYIVNFSKKNTTTQLDHFFDKSTYPYLAISLYNLIPCCVTCNQKKSSKKYEIFYPYIDDFNKKTKFTYFFNNKDKNNKHSSLFSKERISIDLKPLDKNDKKIQNTIDMFMLKELYNEHKDIVLELMQKREIYSDSYIDELANNYSSLFKNKEDLLRLITCGYIEDKDINKRPLSKLIKDISEELELI